MSELVDTRTGEVVDMEPLARAERMLAAIASAEDALDVIDFAEAARVFAQRAKLGIGSVNHATVIKVLAELRLAAVVKEGRDAGQIAKQGRQGNHRGAVVSTLADLGVQQQRLAEARKMAKKYTPEKIRALAAECTAAEQEMSRRQLLNGEAVQQSITNEWYTPAKYIDAARAVLGGFDLDPASCAEANETVKAERYFTASDDALHTEWHGRVWLNPPYGRLAGHFVVYLDTQHEIGNITSAITLVNAHCTDTAWFQPLWDHTLCFTDHRIDFSAGTEARSGSTHGSVFAYLGPDHDGFAREFGQFGAILRRWPPP